MSCRRSLALLVVDVVASNGWTTDDPRPLICNSLLALMFFLLSLDCYSKQVAKPVTSGGNEASGRILLARVLDADESRVLTTRADNKNSGYCVTSE